MSLSPSSKLTIRLPAISKANSCHIVVDEQRPEKPKRHGREPMKPSEAGDGLSETSEGSHLPLPTFSTPEIKPAPPKDALSITSSSVFQVADKPNSRGLMSNHDPTENNAEGRGSKRSVEQTADALAAKRPRTDWKMKLTKDVQSGDFECNWKECKQTGCRNLQMHIDDAVRGEDES